jgi:hypothetical protein
MLAYRGGRFAPIVLLGVSALLVTQRAEECRAETLNAAQKADRICGPHALFLLLRLYGIEIPYERAMVYMPSDASGMSLLQLRDACADCGLQVEVRRCTIDDLGRLPFPVIAHLSRQQPNRVGHYVVWTRVVDKNRIEMLDATTGHAMRWPIERLPELWEGWILMPSNRLPAGVLIPLAAVIGPWLIVGMIVAWRYRASRTSRSEVGQARPESA